MTMYGATLAVELIPLVFFAPSAQPVLLHRIIKLAVFGDVNSNNAGNVNIVLVETHGALIRRYVAPVTMVALERQELAQLQRYLPPHVVNLSLILPTKHVPIVVHPLLILPPNHPIGRFS